MLLVVRRAARLFTECCDVIHVGLTSVRKVTYVLAVA